MSQPERDNGFTLIEVLVVVALLGALMAISVGGYDRWSRASEQSGTAREVQTLLRSTHQRAITEGTALCVLFDTAQGEYAVRRGTCATPGATIDGPFSVAGPEVHLTSPTFAGSGGPGVTFYSRGTATSGTVQVTRTGSSKTYTIHVEQLTGRVSLS
ncbi:MAG TPA: GspH/FimT family pseudopilin [Nocardioides sp.]|nr:GspH/FimT family pseudopilin [Nocardioides sp.]